MSQEPEKPIKNFTDLKAWQESHKLVLKVYKLSKKFPIEEQFGLTIQIRRAAISITSNIAEGFGRTTAADRSYFYTVSLGSIREVQNQLYLAKDLQYMSSQEFIAAAEQTIVSQKLISGLIKATKARG